MDNSPFSGQGSLYGVPISARRARQGIRLRRRFARKYGYTGTESFPLSATVHPLLGRVFGLKQVTAERLKAETEPIDYSNAVFIGTIRMGYGHYRIGMALASAVHALGKTPYWFDLLGFDAAGARMIRDLDRWYSFFSRLSQKSVLFNRLLWDPLLGQWYRRLDKNFPIMEASAIFADVYRDIPADTPFLATHPFNAHGALHAGLRRVINVVPDNCPLGFHVAPGAVHAVQSPSAYFTFRTLRGMAPAGPAGIPAEQLRLAGHYVDHELVANVEPDCAARLERLHSHAPRRLLISLGGAGAQQDLLAKIISQLLPRVRENKAALFVNCGDHRNALDRFRRLVPGFDTAVRHECWRDTEEFADRAAREEMNGLHVFLHEDPFAAVYATNRLMRVSDILITKPSELAFYPIPKLLLERVGGHEAWGAIRASELGDGSPECAGMPFTLQTLNLMVDQDDLPAMYCRQIKRLCGIGVYDGAYAAVKAALG